MFNVLPSRRQTHAGDTTAVCVKDKYVCLFTERCFKHHSFDLNGPSHQKRESVTSITALTICMSRTFVETAGAPGLRLKFLVDAGAKKIYVMCSDLLQAGASG